MFTEKNETLKTTVSMREKIGLYILMGRNETLKTMGPWGTKNRGIYIYGKKWNPWNSGLEDDIKVAVVTDNNTYNLYSCP